MANRDPELEYWIDAFLGACEEAGIATASMCQEARDIAGQALLDAKRVQFEAMGHDRIPDPMMAELRATKDAMVKERDRHEKELGKEKDRISAAWRERNQDLQEALWDANEKLRKAQ